MNHIRQCLASDKPFFIGRIAGVELLTAYNQQESDILELSHNIIELENNAGIKVKDHDSLTHYTTKLMEAYDHCTCIAEWEVSGPVYAKTGKGQELVTTRTPHIPKVNARVLEPYYFSEEESWMPLLKGKHILIIHPFVETIKQQLPRLTTVFPDKKWFEDCTFTVIKPPMTLAGNHQNQSWDKHLTAFLSHTYDFDVALIAAGGYGMLIADELFKRGKSVMYIGGALQLFFGIIGRRWFENKEIMAMVNDTWTRPLPADKPAGATKVEKGCYW